MPGQGSDITKRYEETSVGSDRWLRNVNSSDGYMSVSYQIVHLK